MASKNNIFDNDKDKCRCDDLNPYEIQCLYHENQLEIAYQEEINKNPIDFKMEIEQVFEPEDCTMVMEDYGKCQDYPCDDCIKRFLNKMCKNCWVSEKHTTNTWDMCRSCADEVHKELGGFIYPWDKQEGNKE